MRYGFLPKPQGHKDQGIDLNCPRLHGIFLSHINMKSQISQLNYIIQYKTILYIGVFPMKSNNSIPSSVEIFSFL